MGGFNHVYLELVIAFTNQFNPQKTHCFNKLNPGAVMKLHVMLLYGFLLASLTFGLTGAQDLSVGDLRVEYMTDPVGIDLLEPRLSWIVRSERRDTRQIASHIQVTRAEPAFDSPGRIVWDTGMCESDRSIQIVYQGQALASGERYYWRVRIRDNHERESDWSEAAFWEMGLLQAGDWLVEWIEPDLEEDVSTSPPAPMLRREFRLNGQIRSAKVYVTSHGVYELEINGKRVGDHVLSPGWTSYHHRLQYQTYDVTSHLREGDNAAGVMLGDGWFRGFIGWGDQRNYYGSTLALLMQLVVTYEDGRSEVIGTDGDWKATTGPILWSDIYNGEFYDARLELDGWSEPGFDDSAWSGVRLVDHGKEKLIAQQAPPVRKIQELKPREILVTPEGHTVADMGQNMVGWIRLRVEGEAGTAVTLRHAEVLDRDGNFYTDNLRAADQTNTYILRGDGVEIWEPRFTFQGFRYVAVDGYPGELSPDDLTGVILHSDIEPTGHFQSSNPLLNQLQHNIIWGQKGNFLEIPTDCPQRDERMGWTGDIQVFAEAANLNMNTGAFLTKWLGDLEADQLDDGRIPHVVPNVLGDGASGASGWADAGVIVPWSMYNSFGDIRILERQYESMKAWVGYMKQRASSNENTYLWDGDFTFGDWLSYNSDRPDYPGAYTDKDLINTAFFAHSTNLLSKMARILGNDDDHTYYSELYEKIRQAFQREYVTPGGRIMSDTQTSYLLALRFGLLTDEQIPAAVEHLVGNIRRHGHLTTGFLGTPHLNPILSEYGYPELAYELLLRKDYPSWLYPVTVGATTIWERWDGIRQDGTFQNPGMNSLNHYAYGAIGEWLFREMAGIRQAEPGYKTILIRPVPGGNLDHARALLYSPYGTIETSWEIDEYGFSLNVEIPANTGATIILPEADLGSVTESGIPLFEVGGVKEAVQHNRQVVVSVGSGRYRFRYTSQELALVGNDDSAGNSGNSFERDHKIGWLLADRKAREILYRYMPELMHSPWLSQVMGFSPGFAMFVLPERYRISDAELESLYREVDEL
jgi:alpha-L-rhamnosidase